ncbi:MAG: RNA polymerase sigma factor [Actinomycetota bacterium]|nr:RNA polymerase sigma factor [Actinomycetota bacterium]
MVEGKGYRNGAASLFPFEDLYIRYRHKLIHFFVAKGLEPDVAEDLSQEVFFRFLRSDRPLESEDHARNSLFRIAQNLLIDFFRKHNGSVRVDAFARDDLLAERDLYLVAEEADPEESLISDETSQDVLSALSRLPSHYAQAIRLKEYDGLSYREIAARMGVSEKSVESLLYRARSQLKDDLVETGRRRGGWWSGMVVGLRAVGNRVRRRPWRALRRLGSVWKSYPVSVGAVGTGSYVLNVAVIVLLLGSMVGGGVAMAVSIRGEVPAAVTVVEEPAAEAAVGGGEGAAAEPVSSPESGGCTQPGRGGPAAVFVEGEGQVIPALLAEARGSMDGLLSKAGEATRGLVVTAGDGLDSLLTGLGFVLRSLSDPLGGVLLGVGVPRAALDALLGMVDMEELRGIVSGLVDAAVGATYAGEEAMSALESLPLVEDIGKAVASPSRGESEEEAAMPGGSDTDEGDAAADPVSPAANEEAREHEAGSAPGESQAEGDIPVKSIVNETVDLLESVTGGVLKLHLPL